METHDVEVEKNICSFSELKKINRLNLDRWET